MQSAVLRSHVRLSVTLVDCDHIGWKSWKLLHVQLAKHLRCLQPKGDPPNPRGTWGNFGETRGEVEKKWRSGEHNVISGNISETRKDRGKVTMDGL